MKSQEPQFSVPPAQAPESPQANPEFDRLVAVERAFAANLDARRPLATYALIGLCALTFGLQFAVPHLDDVGVNQGAAVLAGQWWRLFACVFLHGGVAHIGMNMYALFVIGPFLERVLGTPRFVVLYALAGLAGSVASAMVHPHQSSLGASGAIWGLMGAAMGLAIRPHALLPPFTAQNTKRRLAQPLLINLVISFMPGIDAVAHFGGGGAGFLLLVTGALTAGAAPQYLGAAESSASRATWTVLAGVLSLAMVASVGTAVVLALGA